MQSCRGGRQREGKGGGREVEVAEGSIYMSVGDSGDYASWSKREMFE